MSACEWGTRAPALAIAAQAVPDCHEAPAANRNLCLSDCLSGDHSAPSPSLPVLAFASGAVLTISVADPGAAGVARLAVANPPEPPPRIRFSILRI